MYKYFVPFPPGTDELLHALRVCDVLHEEQARAILRSCGVKDEDFILHLLLDRKILYKYASFIAAKPLTAAPSRRVTAAMWVYLEFIGTTKDHFSKGMYPAQIIFPYGDYSIELIVLDGDVNVELGHIFQRERPKILTKYIFVFYDSVSKQRINSALFPEQECLFATLIFPDDGVIPAVYLETREE